MLCISLAGLLVCTVLALNTITIICINHDLGVIGYVVSLVGYRILYYAVIEAELEQGRVVTRTMECCLLAGFLGFLLSKQNLVVALPYLIMSTMCRWSDLLLSHPHLQMPDANAFQMP